MKIDIKIPPMGESISEATIGEILKPNGSQVLADEEILELETDKVNQVLYSPKAGKLILNVSKDEVVKIDQVIGFVETESTGELKFIQEKFIQAQKEAEPVSVQHGETNEVKKSEEKARLMKEDFVTEVTSSTTSPSESKNIPAPAIVKENLPKKSSNSSKPETRRKMSKIRKVIAQRLVEAKQTTAMLTTFNEVDLSQVMGLREKYKDNFLKTYGVKLGFMSFFVEATVSALKAFPDINSYIDDDEIVHREYYDMGIAVGTDKGLVVPVVRECDQLSFAQIEQKIESLAKKARDGGLSVDDLQGGGFTITNGGTYGSLLSTPILNLPQSAILGMHKIEKRPVVVDDQIVIRPMMYLALSYDHRIIDGKQAVSFLVHIKNLLEDPSRIMLEV